jgi:hypothetical protein
MRKEQLTDIQKTLNWIRDQAEKSDAQAKVEVLALLNGTSQSVIAMAKKLTAPTTKTQTKVVTQFRDRPEKPKSKIVKQGRPPETVTDRPATPFQAIQPQAPIGPIGPDAPMSINSKPFAP